MLTHMRFRHPSLNEGRHECLFVYRPAAPGKCEIETLVPSHSDASMTTAERQVTLPPKCRIRSSCGSMEAATSASLGPLTGIPDSAVFLGSTRVTSLRFAFYQITRTVHLQAAENLCA